MNNKLPVKYKGLAGADSSGLAGWHGAKPVQVLLWLAVCGHTKLVYTLEVEPTPPLRCGSLHGSIYGRPWPERVAPFRPPARKEG